jgi:hypothetical protein
MPKFRSCMRGRAIALLTMATLLARCPWNAHGFRVPPSPCAVARMGAPPEREDMCRREARASVASSLTRAAAAAAVAVAGSRADRPADAAAAATPSAAPTFGNAVPVPQAGQVPGLFQNAKGYGKGSFAFLSRRAAG